MTDAERYRLLAAELEAKADQNSSLASQIELRIIARSYRRLAHLAEQHARADIYYEPPLERRGLQQQQAQQIQPKSRDEQ
jgi:hypothetical protein